MTELSLRTGLREFEVTNLQTQWLPEPAETIQKPEVIFEHHRRKGNKSGYVWLPLNLFDRLTEYRDFTRSRILERQFRKDPHYREPDELFLNRFGQPFDPKGCQRSSQKPVMQLA